MVAARLEKAGATIDRYARPFSHLTEVADAYFQLLMPLLLGSYEPHELEVMSARSPNAKFVKLICAGRQQTSASMAQAKEVQARAISSWRAFFERFDALICPVAPHAAFPHNLSLPSVERELVVEGRHYPYWDHVIWSGALANFAYLPATARPITFRTTDGNPDRRPISGRPNTDPRGAVDGRSIRRLRTTSAICGKQTWQSNSRISLTKLSTDSQLILRLSFVTRRCNPGTPHALLILRKNASVISWHPPFALL